MSIPPSRTHAVQEAPIQKLLAEVSLPKDTISLGQGVPFFSPPAKAITAAANALADDCCFRYTEDAGLLTLREQIAKKLKAENNIKADPNKNIIVTSGANQAFMNALMAVTNLGDDVLILSPYYFNNIMAIKLAGCNPVIVPTTNTYKPDIQSIMAHVTSRTRALVSISPNNPAGEVYSKKILEEINKFCADSKIYHISDEAYEHFIFDDAEHHSPMSFRTGAESTISLFSFSKSYGMSGYRVGYMVYPSRLHDEVLKVQDTIGICPPGPSQAAAEAALTLGSSYPQSHLSTMAKVRQLIINRLNSVGNLEFIKTKGSFYFLFKLETNQSSWELAKRLIEDYKVITIPGEVFGMETTALRISYGNLSIAQAEEGIDRLAMGLERLIQ